MFSNQDTISSPSKAAPADQKQRSIATSTDYAVDDIFTRLTSTLTDYLAKIDTCHDSNQETINRLQTALESQVAQAAHLSGYDRRWLGAKHWQALLGLDQIKEEQEVLMACKAVVVEFLATIKCSEQRLQGRKVIMKTEKEKLLGLLEMTAQWC